jgi:hypothetical protein
MTGLMEHVQRIQRPTIGRDAIGESRRPAQVSSVSLAGGPSQGKSASDAYDSVDLRLIDTFPASDAVARY